MVLAEQMPLPTAKKNFFVIVSMWNRRKGCINEMTRKLDEMHFNLAKGTPKINGLFCVLFQATLLSLKANSKTARIHQNASPRSSGGSFAD